MRHATRLILYNPMDVELAMRERHALAWPHDDGRGAAHLALEADGVPLARGRQRKDAGAAKAAQSHTHRESAHKQKNLMQYAGQGMQAEARRPRRATHRRSSQSSGRRASMVLLPAPPAASSAAPRSKPPAAATHSSTCWEEERRSSRRSTATSRWRSLFTSWRQLAASLRLSAIFFKRWLFRLW